MSDDDKPRSFNSLAEALASIAEHEEAKMRVRARKRMAASIHGRVHLPTEDQR